MIKKGDKVRFISSDYSKHKNGNILIVDSVSEYNTDTGIAFITFKGGSGFWVFPDPNFFELLPNEVGIKYDSDKLRFDLIPPECEAMIAAILTIGGMKYADNNWMRIEEIQKRYFNAECRHMNAKRLGEVFDTESGLPHSAHAIVSLIFVLWEDIKDNIGAENVLSFISEKLKNYKDILNKK
jgi:hypothetical protein